MGAAVPAPWGQPGPRSTPHGRLSLDSLEHMLPVSAGNNEREKTSPLKTSKFVRKVSGGAR